MVCKAAAGIYATTKTNTTSFLIQRKTHVQICSKKTKTLFTSNGRNAPLLSGTCPPTHKSNFTEFRTHTFSTDCRNLWK